MQVFLDAIYENYIIFVLVSIFLTLALIGYFVDKKTRKDSDIKPFFSMVGTKKGEKAPKKEKVKKEKKKGKKEYKSVIVGGDTPPSGSTGIAQAVGTASGSAPVKPAPSTMNNQVASPASKPVTPSPVQGPAVVKSPIQTPVAPAAPQPIPQAPAAPVAPNATPQNITTEEEMPMNLNMTE